MEKILIIFQQEKTMSNFYVNTSFDNPAIISNENSLFTGVLSSDSSNYYINLSTLMPIEFKDRKDLGKIVSDSIDVDFKLNTSKRIVLPVFEEKENLLLCKIEIFLATDIPFEDVVKIFKNGKKFRCWDIKKIELDFFRDPRVMAIHIPGLDDTPVSSCDSWKGLTFDDRLLSDVNYLTNESPFNRYYGIESQIRMVLSSLKSSIDSGGKRMTHCVLFGPPACGKTSVLTTLEEIVGKHNVLKLDATTTTKAGVEKLFLNTVIPPIIILEEVEKANEDWLRNWLSLLDERSEIRKVSHKETIVKDIDILFFCTVNDSDKFNDLLDGALASRCKNKIYFPRPTEETIKKILFRDVQENGGKVEWVEPALLLAKELNIDDPRVIISFLSGGDRLLDGSYQKDKKNCLEINIL
jgi:hypothetical protein